MRRNMNLESGLDPPPQLPSERGAIAEAGGKASGLIRREPPSPNPLRMPPRHGRGSRLGCPDAVVHQVVYPPGGVGPHHLNAQQGGGHPGKNHGGRQGKKSAPPAAAAAAAVVAATATASGGGPYSQRRQSLHLCPRGRQWRWRRRW